MRKLVSILIVASFALLVLPAVVSANPVTVDLVAGQHINVGTVTVSNDEDWLFVEYEITEPDWCLTETHLHVAENLDDIPQRNGNPPPGQFDHQMEHDCVPGYPYDIDLEWAACTDLFIAAHGVVQKVEVIEEAPYDACSVDTSSQGLTKVGDPVRLQRSDPQQGLVFEPGQYETNFFSLGFEGWIVVEFCCPVTNGEGFDVLVIEDTWGSGYPLETADVEASQDGTTWTYLGVADNTNQAGIHTISEFDLGALEWATHIKITDTTPPGPHQNNADGYDLNAVQALQDCVEIQEETAWATGLPFPGKNWATYFMYHVQCVLVETVAVPSDGTVVSSVALLDSGTAYCLEFTGTAFAGDTIEFDAKCSITTKILGDTWTDFVTGYEGHGPDLLELKVDGDFVDWGPLCNPLHVYEWTMTGTGGQVELQIYDTYPDNNIGDITVNIYKWCCSD